MMDRSVICKGYADDGNPPTYCASVSRATGTR